ncbi:MAG: DUF4105 domain-containing protein [Bacteroidales bacterium]|nr:DUF4105 domain-containing protein [Bacteroidales bacterium]MDD4657407.1 DUF4105 domain-containing protein [Bacteroidales bacterium]
MESKTIKLYLFLLLTIFFINFSSTLLANEQATHQTNDQAVYQSIVYPKISLLTCDSGNELYSTFGHSALRVYYPESGKDIVFNFGLFDFNTPYFYTKFGINLLLGSSLDRITNSYESMFLPENLYEGTALLYNGDAPLVSENVYLYKAPESEKNISFIDSLISPFIVFSLLFAVMLFVFIRGIVTGKKKLLYIFNNTYLGLISLLGLVLIVIVLITEHTELYANYNLLWCNPLFFFVLVASFKRWRKAERLFCTISLLFIALLQIVWAYGIQYVEPGFIPIVTTLALSFAIRLILPYSSGTIVKPTSSR